MKEVRLSCGGGFFFFSLFSLSFPRKSRPNFQENKLCPLVCNLINFGPPFNYCLFGFWTFMEFGFFSISSLSILFKLICFIQFGPSTFNCSIFVLYTFLIIFFLQFNPFLFYCIFFNLLFVLIVLIAIFLFLFLIYLYIFNFIP
jgi:hypothetical protein